MIYKIIRWSVLAIVLVGVGVGVYYFFFKEKEEGAAEDALGLEEEAKKELISSFGKS